MVTIYTATNCGSCKKAKKWLEEHQISFKEHNLSSTPLAVEEIKRILQMTESGTDEIISTRSNMIRKLNIKIQELSMKDLIDFIKKYPGLLKKPIILDEKRLQVGYNKDDIRKFLPREARAFKLLSGTI